MTSGERLVASENRNFEPRLDILPPAQRRLWDELGATPPHFVLYGGTAIALRLGHRHSEDFDFFSNQSFDPEALAKHVSYMKDSKVRQVGRDTLVCEVQRGGPVRLGFYGNQEMDRVKDPDKANNDVWVASLVDLACTKLKTILFRPAAKDYRDLDSILLSGVGLADALAAARALFPSPYAPYLSVKALMYFDDVPNLPADVQKRLSSAARTAWPHVESLPHVPTQRGLTPDEGQP